ncbi:hydrolase [Aurantimonas coralicida]|uniref:hydrolase n=1 Tax=Aurantimonas coralicida TaxID=182270 RepID=UPI001E299E63|nr:hydrolase [Aurantimonas coralicida]MCD1644043.1 hydrolase [Aurantimonas coralicida]
MTRWTRTGRGMGMAALTTALCGIVAGGPSVAAATPDEAVPPIVFVHGDSDSAAFWMPVLWRFESNGVPAERLFAVDIDHPAARLDDKVAQENRSSTEDAARAVAATVDRALAEAGADKVAIVGHSRGCQSARNYVKNFGGAARTATMVLAGCVHHGVYVNPEERTGSEYNGAGAFLTALNTPPAIPEGIPTTILRSDRFDLYAQPNGRFLGLPEQETGVSYDAPELDGAPTVVLDGADHRETASSPEALIAMYTAITGKPPARLEITPEERPQIGGEISGFANGAPTNRPLAGATLDIFAVDARTGERLGDAVFSQTVGEDGRYGPFRAAPDAAYEFVIAAKGYPLTRIYRAPFPRSTTLAHLRLYPAPDLSAPGEIVGMMRPRGYFGIDDNATLDALPIAGRPENEPVPSVWRAAVAIPGDTPQTVTGGFDGEVIAARTSPDDPNDVVWIELTD